MRKMIGGLNRGLRAIDSRFLAYPCTRRSCQIVSITGWSKAPSLHCVYRRSLFQLSWRSETKDGSQNSSVTRVEATSKTDKDVAVSPPPHYVFSMPDIADKNIVGTVTQWYKKEKEAVTEGELLCEIETENLVVDEESPMNGVLARIVVPTGTPNVPVGQTLAILVSDPAHVDAFKDIKQFGVTESSGYGIQTEDEKQSAEVLKLLTQLHAENKIKDEVALSALKSLAMKNDGKLLIVYNAFFDKAEDGSMTGDVDSFIKNALELVSKQSIESAGAVDVLRAINRLAKEGKITDKEHLRILKKLARRSDPDLLVTYSSSYDKHDNFDEEGFLEGCEEIVNDYLEEKKQQEAASSPGQVDGKGAGDPSS